MSHKHNWILPDGSNWITPDGSNWITPEPVLHLAVPAGRLVYPPAAALEVFPEEPSRTVAAAREDRTVYATTNDSEAAAEE
jgi:hypothetical protein